MCMCVKLGSIIDLAYGLQGHSNGYSVSNIAEGSFIKEGTVSVKAVCEGLFTFSASKARKKFDSTAALEQGSIRELFFSDW